MANEQKLSDVIVTRKELLETKQTMLNERLARLQLQGEMLRQAHEATMKELNEVNDELKVVRPPTPAEAE